MSTEESSSDLEVVSKDMAGSTLSESVDSKLTTPEESPNVLHADSDTRVYSEKEVTKLDAAATNGDSGDYLNGTVDAKTNGSASALMSPLYEPLNLDAVLSDTGGRTGLQRAPSILQRAHDVGNNWELYRRAGPRYPTSLEHLIMKYHQHHSNSWQLAHDLGAGSGVYASTLANFFRHIHISDPTASGVATSRKFLTEYNAKHPEKRGRFTFSSNAPEEAEESFADGSVDLAIIMESAHFTDAEKTVRSVAATLAPKGTLAIVTHRPVSRVAGNQDVAAAVERLFTAWGRRPWEIACGTDTKSQQQFNLGLDFVPVPDDLFAREKTRRITINAHAKPRDFFRVPGLDDETSHHENGMSTLSHQEMYDIPCSRVDGKEKCIAYDGEDEQARGWRFEVGWESFRTRIALLDSPDTVRRLEPHLNEVKELIMKTSPNGVTVVIEWAVSVILASRN
ncbi:hypothetical protein LTR78_002625 [Recurvomyces mirabilis]|uniref:Methyltransferase type 11 domain-containing protein n=1 Tax=Recurvomyces mirabilis TaxID=574656 RepID=A0AAE1C4D9_9PEZI|nr:hypothetical protein LTR78_002625 [Recurvomyces mirabilis]KAK5157554.1 hypothetical protein LTS14_004319 [Recurvomyces mirabilis]